MSISLRWKHVLLLMFFSAPFAFSQSDDLSQLLHDVHVVGTHANEEEGPAAIAILSRNVFPVVVGRAEGRAVLPIIAAARLGKGRVVALGEKGLLGDPNGAPVLDDDKFLANAIAWVHQARLRDDNTRICVMKLPGFATRLRTAGHVHAESRTFHDISGCDVIVAGVDDVTAQEAGNLRRFLKDGGGLVLAASVSHWEDQNTSGETVEEYPGNAILAPAGILWTDVDVLGDTNSAYTVTGNIPLMASAPNALELVRDLRQGGASQSVELEQASRVLMTTVGIVPATDHLFLPGLRQAMDGFRPSHYPSAEVPVTKSDLLTRISLALDRREMDITKPERMKAYPSAGAFPGTVPMNAKAITENIQIDTSHPRWHSTGLYASPGQVVRIDVPSSVVNQGFKVRIGAHTDTLWHLDKWERFPDISLVFPIRTEHVRAANPFGGLIYIEVPEKTQVRSFTATVRGAFQSPRFILGETTPEQWTEMCRNAQAPWGEVESASLILTAPLPELKKLDNPAELMGFWDRILQAQADLAGWPSTPASPERIVFDQQISAGYLHSGYPIMGPLSLAGHLFPQRICPSQAILRADVGAITTNLDTTIKATIGLFAARSKSR